MYVVVPLNIFIYNIRKLISNVTEKHRLTATINLAKTHNSMLFDAARVNSVRCCLMQSFALIN